MRSNWVGRWSLRLLGLWLMACSGSKPAQSADGSAKLGHSPEDPVVTCGPRESYAHVAQKFRCPDGSNPLAGDIARARRARRGSMRAPHGDHVLDRYDVPCSGGPVAIYIDMYGCPEYAEQLAQSQSGTPEGAALLRSFQAGNLEGVIAHCQPVSSDQSADERALCMALNPASLYGLHRDPEGRAALMRTCMQLPAASSFSDVRAVQLAMTFAALTQLAQTGKLELTEEQRKALIDDWLRACSVPKAQFDGALESMQQN